MKSYDYAHREGVNEISWEEFGELAVKLAEGVARFHPQVIVGIARAGLFPATALACMLRLDLFPARLTRRLNDQIVHSKPVWKTSVSPEVAGKSVIVVDEIADSGKTLAMAVESAQKLGAAQVVTACLVSHSWARPQPDVAALVSDALVIFPWDREVFIDGEWRPHPEITTALKAQSSRTQ